MAIRKPPGPDQPARRGISPLWWIIPGAAVVLLSLIVVAVAGGRFGRRTAEPPTPEVAPPPQVVISPTPGDLPVRPVSGALHGLAHPDGEYAFNYPANWEGYVVGKDTLFLLTSGAAVRVHVEPAPEALSLEQYIQEVNRFPPVDVLETWETSLGDAYTVCQKVSLPSENRLRACACFALHRDHLYIVSLTGLEELLEPQQQESVDEFFVVLRSFILEDG